ncbi:MAG TPA: CRTAC1 family protein [Candidatus Dormibacteraeota bacterium]|nr:CRTAC1 family protein [Candidatus Dormibacteraeota bacterium]
MLKSAHMLGYPSRFLVILICFLIFSPASSKVLAAQTQGPQRVPVPVPPPVKRSPAAKKDRSGFPPVPVFKDIAKEVGLAVSHIAAAEAHYVIDSTSGGSGLFDCDNDARLDIVLVNGSTVERLRQGGDPMVTLYHQEPNGTFKDITQDAGLTRLGWGMGVAVADYDNDGKLDLFVTGYNGNVLYHNLGNCKFEDVTEKAGVRGGGFSTGAAWGDYDRDGNVDLFVARYSHLDMNNLPQFGSNKFCRFKGILVQCGPWGLEGESDFLYHNRGDGTFEEVSVKAGVHDDIGYYGLGVMWADYDDDGWPDLLVANDSVPNYLYHNNHDGTFTDVGLLTGVALSGEGLELGNMGVDFGDYDHSGRLSFFVTHFEEQPNSLYRNVGVKGFDDVSWTSGVGQPGYPYVAWGTAFFDMDNDTWLDLLVANGHVYPQVDTLDSGPRFREPLLLHRNNRDGTFDEVSKEAGLQGLPLKSRRGAAFGDIFNTGNIDVVLLNVGEPPSLLLNTNQSGYHRVLFRLVGTKSNRAAIGARVIIRAGGVQQFSEVRGGGSYLSQNDLRLHFGLGAAAKMEAVEIRWPNGNAELLQDVGGDYIYTIVEGKGIQDRKPLPPLSPAHGTPNGAR